MHIRNNHHNKSSLAKVKKKDVCVCVCLCAHACMVVKVGVAWAGRDPGTQEGLLPGSMPDHFLVASEPDYNR